MCTCDTVTYYLLDAYKLARYGLVQYTPFEQGQQHNLLQVTACFIAIIQVTNIIQLYSLCKQLDI